MLALHQYQKQDFFLCVQFVGVPQKCSQFKNKKVSDIEIPRCFRSLQHGCLQMRFNVIWSAYGAQQHHLLVLYYCVLRDIETGRQLHSSKISQHYMWWITSLIRGDHFPKNFKTLTVNDSLKNYKIFQNHL